MDVYLCVWRLRCVSCTVSNLTSRIQTLIQVSHAASYHEVDHSTNEMIAPSLIFLPRHCQGCHVMLSQVDCVLFCPAEIQYTLTLDALRAKARASFLSSDDKSDRRITGRVNVRDRAKKPSCVNETFMMSASTLIFIMSAWGHLWFLTCKESTPKH